MNRILVMSPFFQRRVAYQFSSLTGVFRRPRNAELWPVERRDAAVRRDESAWTAMTFRGGTLAAP
jgi:hypothetical protein